jgi:transcriptional regulator with XRE-family HTH domain
MNYQDIGKRIRQRRSELNLTQQELADQLQVTNKAISKWETGEGYPDISILNELSSVLKISTDDLLGSAYQKIDVPKQTDLSLIHKMILLGSVPLIYLLPMMQKRYFFFGIEELGASQTLQLSGYKVISQIPETGVALLSFISLVLIIAIAVLLLVEYFLNTFKQIELFPWLKEREVKFLISLLLMLSIPFPLYVGVMTGIEIGMILVTAAITLIVYLELKTLIHKS